MKWYRTITVSALNASTSPMLSTNDTRQVRSVREQMRRINRLHRVDVLNEELWNPLRAKKMRPTTVHRRFERTSSFGAQEARFRGPAAATRAANPITWRTLSNSVAKLVHSDVALVAKQNLIVVV
jgi:hypothetical protein